MLNFADEFRKIRESLGISQQKMAEMIGIPQKTWSNYESGRTTPKMDILWTLATKGYAIEGLTLEPLKHFKLKKSDKETIGKNIKDALSSSTHDTGYIKELLSQNQEFNFFKFSNKKPLPILTDETDTNALTMLPVYSQRAAGGTGQPPTQLEEIEAYIPVIYELLGGVNPKNCGIVRVVGDSMSDITLFNGDYVIFDRSQLEGNGVYVISMGGDVRVKRLEYRMFEKKIIISSENQKSYPNPEIITFEQAQEMLVIHGKVISWVHRHPY